MTDKIIEAAKAAGVFTPSGYCATVTLEIAERFYAIARAEALEDAVSACDFVMAPINIGSIQLATAFHDGTHACIEAIRQLKEQQHG